MELSQLIDVVPEVAPMDNIEKVRSVMAQAAAKVVAVVSDGHLLGVITEPALTRHESLPELTTFDLLARDMMNAPIQKIPIATPVIEAARTMRSQRMRYAALVDDKGSFAGLVTLRRVLFEVMDELDLKVDNLERELMADGPGG